MTSTKPITDSANQWWIAKEGKPTGPFSTAEVQQKWSQQEITGDTMMCPVGGSEWQPASEHSSRLHEPALQSNSIPPPPKLPPGILTWNPLAWIQYYAIYLNPTTWMLGMIVTFSYGSGVPRDSVIYGRAMASDVAFLMLSSVCMAIILFGGLKLRKSVSNGSKFVLTGVFFSLLIGVADLIIVAGSFWEESGVDDNAAFSLSDAVALLLLLVVLLVALADFACQIFAIVFLGRKIGLLKWFSLEPESTMSDVEVSKTI